MIILCPCCGFKLRCPLKNGISSCENCQRIFDSSSFYKLLSSFWMHKNWHVETDVIKKHCDLTDDEANLIHERVIEKDCNYEELIDFLRWHRTSVIES